MWLGILGFVLLIGIMFILIKGKFSPVVAFTILPIIAALILGYNPFEIGEFISDGVGTTTSTAVLFLFSIPFFGIMNELGVFDPLVNRLVKISGDNFVAITVCTVLIATIAHLDGSAASTALITVPAMLPIYKKMNIRPTVLVLLIAASTGVMNLMPWGGPTMRVGSVMGLDPNEIWKYLIPIQIAGLVLSVILAVYLGIREKKNVSLAKAYYESLDDSSHETKATRGEILSIPKWKLAFNAILIVVVIGILASGKITSFVVFMIGLAIALFVNYPTLKEQQAALKRQATGVIAVVIVLLTSGVLVGIMGATNMLTEMSNLLLSVIPNNMGQAFNLIIGFIAAPMGIVMGTDAYFFGLFPLVAEVGKNFGFPEMSIALTMLIGKNSVVVASPMVPATFLLLGLAGVEMKEHLKFSLPWLICMSWILILFGFFVGII